MKVVIDSWAWLQKASLSELQIARLRTALTVLPREDPNYPKEKSAPLYLYTETPELFGVAREYFLSNRRAEHEYVLNVSEGSLWPGPLTFAGALREEQSRAIAEISQKFKNGGVLGGMLKASPGWGKCLKIGTPILLFDGRVVPVEDVKVGDLLMGPDSKARHVLSTTQGEGPLFEVATKHGRPWVCNDVHILTLVHSVTNEIQDIEIRDYLRLSTHQKHHLKQFSPADGVDFPRTSDTRLLDPYFLGVWLGDGTKALNGVAISKPDAEIEQLCQDMARRYGLRVRTDVSGSCPTHHIVGEGRKNDLLDQMRLELGDASEIPLKYLNAPRGCRQLLLAGFLDADGYHNNGCYQIVQKRLPYAEAVAYLARSLGIRASIKPKDVNGTRYWRVQLAGDFSQLPMRICRKVPRKRLQKKVATRAGFKVRSVGSGEYAGFTLDGDGRFLLGDFTVTHNTVATCALIAEMQVPTLVVVHKEFLMSQWRERIEQFLPNAKIGLVQQDECTYAGMHVVMGMVHTLASKKFSEQFIKWPGLVITDECHRVGAATWSTVPAKFPARWRLGITATPRRKDGAEKVFQFHLGDILFSASEQRMKPKIRRVHTTFQVMKTPGFNPSMVNKSVLLKFLCASQLRNRVIAMQTVQALQAGRKLLILSERLNHLEALEKAIREQAGALAPVIDYYVGGRTEAQLAKASKAQVILATSQYAQEGLDIPALDTLVLTTPLSDIEQAVGRILRPFAGKKDPIVVDIRDDKVGMFKAMAAKRDTIYARLT